MPIAILRQRTASPLISPDQIVLPTGDVAGFRVPRFVNDFDRDGFVDQAWLANQGQSLVLEVRWGTPEGKTPETSKSRYVFPREEQDFFEYWGIEDINSDGLADLRLTPFNRPNIYLLSSGARTFQLEFAERTRWQQDSSMLTTEGDIDGDGFDDRVTLVDSLLDGLLTVRRGLPDASFEEQGITYQFRKPCFLASRI